MNLLNFIGSRLKRFFPQCKLYGFSVSIWSLLYPFYRLLGPFKYSFANHKHRAILKYLLIRYKDVLNQYSESIQIPAFIIDPQSTIWVCWWDGEEAMPDLVRACYNSVKQHSGTHQVKLITRYNYGEYINIPDYIMKKVDSKIITITHFSNMVRASLLYDYGGIWMDATILTLKNISPDNMLFFTLKAPAEKSVSITLLRNAGLSNKTAKIYNKSLYQTSRWSGFLLAGGKQCPVFSYMRDILYAYWKDHDDQIDYVLYDYTISLGYDNIPVMKSLIDNVPNSDAEKYEMENCLNSEYSDELYKRFSKDTYHKLSWKKDFKTHTKDNKLTVYGYLLETYLQGNPN